MCKYSKTLPNFYLENSFTDVEILPGELCPHRGIEVHAGYVSSELQHWSKNSKFIQTDRGDHHRKINTKKFLESSSSARKKRG